MKKFSKLLILFAVIFLFLTACNASTVTTKCAVGDYDIHTEDQAKALSGNYNLITVFANGTKEASLPLPVTLDLSDKVPRDVNPPYSVYISESEDMKDPLIFEATEDSISIYNLKIHTNYFYKIAYSGGESGLYAFKVSTSIIRNVYVPGITNCRDLGGYMVDGKYTNQGVIYRTSKLNADTSQVSLLNDTALAILRDDLKIKTEIDLRGVNADDPRAGENGGITSSPIGDGVNYYSIPMTYNGPVMFIQNNRDGIVEVFRILGDENNYPLCFHCSIGTDRTGGIAFFINALLGVSKDNLYYDYLFSNFGNIGSMRRDTIMDSYIYEMEKYPGSSLSEQTRNFLISIGVDENDINTLIRMMKNI